MSTFISCKMGDVVTLEQGLAINKKSKHLIVDNGIPLLRITDMLSGKFNQFIDSLKVPEKFIVKKEDLIFSRTGQVGLIFRNQQGIIHNNCFRVIPDNNIDKGFMYWYLKQSYIKSYINTLASGAAQPDLNHDAFKSVPFFYPESLIEQKSIVNILDSYEKLIENNNRRIAILEEMAQKLYLEWFVKFRFPGHEDINMVESELGLIPEEWEIVVLGSLVDYLRESIPKGTLDEPIPYMGLEHLPRKSIALSSWKMETEIGSTKLKFKKGDILFGKIRPYFHKVGVAQIDGVCSSDTFVLRPKTHFYALSVNIASSDDFVAHSVQTSQGTKMPRANWDVLKEYKVALAPIDILDKFDEILRPMIDSIANLSAKNRNLKGQRDLLLPKLISGKINV